MGLQVMGMAALRLRAGAVAGAPGSCRASPRPPSDEGGCTSTSSSRAALLSTAVMVGRPGLNGRGMGSLGDRHWRYHML